MAGGNFNVPVSWRYYGPIVLAAGQTATWMFRSPLFDEARYVDFDATPDNIASPGGGEYVLQVVSKTATRPVGGKVTYRVVFRNEGKLPVVFRPRFIMASAAQWGGGLDH